VEFKKIGKRNSSFWLVSLRSKVLGSITKRRWGFRKCAAIKKKNLGKGLSCGGIVCYMLAKCGLKNARELN
jgi:hypothetical protein